MNEQPKFFLTHPHECSYLDDLDARNVVLDPESTPTGELYSVLLANGFRRSGQHLYRPNCELCNACVPLRVAPFNFAWTRSQKRVRSINNDLQVRVTPANYTEEHFALYKHYQTMTHGGGMANHDAGDFQDFLITQWALTHFVEFRLPDGELIAVAVVDETPSDLSAVYTYYSPDHPKRSLGTYAVLWQMTYGLAEKKDFVYLGYWIAQCNKMNYKTKFKPCEGLRNGLWQTMDE